MPGTSEKPMETGRSRERVITEIVRSDGMKAFVEVKTRAIMDNGKVTGTRGVVNDITERKRADEALQASQLIIEGIINAIPMRVFWKDKNLVYRGCNAAYARDKGLTDPKDVVGKDDYQMARRDLAELYRSDDRQVIESGFPKLHAEEPSTTLEGNTRTLLTSKVPLRNSKGEVIGILGTYMDITERKRTEIKLEEEQILLRTLIDNLPDRIYAKDVQGRKLMANLADWQASGGKRMEDVIGKTDFDVFPPELAADYWAIDKSVIDTGNSIINHEESGLDAQGNQIRVLTSKVPLRDAQGKATGWWVLAATSPSASGRKPSASPCWRSLQRSNSELNMAYGATIEGWSHALDLRDKETEGHTQRVTEMTMKLARAFGLSDAELVNVRHGALLHDIGKMGVPDNILLKPGKLTEEEWIQMRMHPVYAQDLLSPIAYLHGALDIPYCHHEKWDGTGYPRGLKGEQIPLTARIFAIVDVWDALTSDRPYRKAWSKEETAAHIKSGSGTHFDPQVVKVFLAESGKS